MRVFIFFGCFYLVNAKSCTINKPHACKEIQNKSITNYYYASEASLKQRPSPEWFDKAKIGIFIHWGVYSVSGYDSEWFWSLLKEGNSKVTNYMTNTFGPGFTYQELAPMFKAEFFDPKAWAKLLAKAGAKYVVLTSKHHDGFTMFPSNRSFAWNSVDVGPKRDVVGELASAVKSQNLKFGIYYSLIEWFNPLYTGNKESHFEKRNFVQIKMFPEIKQLVFDYEPSILWGDGDWEGPQSYWDCARLLAWLYNESPVKDEIVVNDRWGLGANNAADFYSHVDMYKPSKLLPHKWENALRLDTLSWGYRKNMNLNQVLTLDALLYQVVSTVSCGGNILINVGPTQEGTIPLIFQERLLSLGSWLSINGEAIYNTSPWYIQKDTWNNYVWYTCVKTTYNAMHPSSIPNDTDNITAVYAIILAWPSTNSVELKNVKKLLASAAYDVKMLGNEDHQLNWTIAKGKVKIQLPNRLFVNSKHAWTLKLTKKIKGNPIVRPTR